MKKNILILSVLLLPTVSCDQSHVRQVQTSVNAGDSELDREIRKMKDLENALEERKSQVKAIAAAFARRTDPVRASRLAVLCYLKTLRTPFMPLDLAEIALAETGGHGLSANAVSSMGALGVWQLMPIRAKSHGFTSDDMLDDEKCATAAVRELRSKLEMAAGDLVRAKKLYCGVGAAANAYESKRRKCRREILDEMKMMTLLEAGMFSPRIIRPS